LAAIRRTRATGRPTCTGRPSRTGPIGSPSRANGTGVVPSTAPNSTRQLLLQRLVAVLELLDTATEPARFSLNRIEVLGQLHQALVRHHALDASDTPVKVIELDLNRIFFRWSRGAPGEYRSDCDSDGSGQHSGHGGLPLWLDDGRLAARSQVHNFDTSVLRPCGFVIACDRRPLGTIAHCSKL
jgi:hypothetical protein